MKLTDTQLIVLNKAAQRSTMLARLSALSDDHFNCAPDDVDWSHVGTLALYANMLKEITDAAFNEGEHAE